MKYTKLFLLIILFLASCAPPAISPTQTFTPEPTATQTPSPTPTIIPTPTQIGGGAGKLIFTYTKEEFVKALPDLKGETNVFTANEDGTDLTPVTNGLDNYNYLKAVSPDGSKVLVASTSNHDNKDAVLYVVNIDSQNTEPIKLADGLLNDYGNNSSAKWIGNSQIVYVGNGEMGFGIYKINSDGTNPINIYKYNNDGVGNKPFEILATDGTRVYWDARIEAQLSSNSFNEKYLVWWSGTDGGEKSPLEFNGKQIYLEDFYDRDSHFSPDGKKIAWYEGSKPSDPKPYYSYFHIAVLNDLDHPLVTIEPMTGFLYQRWFPDGSKILVFDSGSVQFGFSPDMTDSDIYSATDDSGKPIGNLYGVYEVSIDPNLQPKNYKLSTIKMFVKQNITGGYNPAFMDLYDISPDGRQVLCQTYESQGNGNWLSTLNFLDVETLTFSEAPNFTFSNTAVGGIHWLP